MNLKIEQVIAAGALFYLLCKELANNALKKEQSKAGSPHNAVSCDFI